MLLCLLPLRLPAREVGYELDRVVGAVPIILGAFPRWAHVPGAERVFNIVFFIVVISTLLPGATIPRGDALAPACGPAETDPVPRCWKSTRRIR